MSCHDYISISRVALARRGVTGLCRSESLLLVRCILTCMQFDLFLNEVKDEGVYVLLMYNIYIVYIIYNPFRQFNLVDYNS